MLMTICQFNSSNQMNFPHGKSFTLHSQSFTRSHDMFKTQVKSQRSEENIKETVISRRTSTKASCHEEDTK